VLANDIDVPKASLAVKGTRRRPVRTARRRSTLTASIPTCSTTATRRCRR
jgi:hypothetical protein